MAKRSDPNPAYWDGYSPFNQVKHDLIRCYLNGWYPKLGFWAGRVLYADTHAGRGKYETGDPGSPVVALQTFLDHRARPALLAKSEFNFLFIERDPENLESLRAELARFDLPKRVNVETSESDAFDKLSAILANLKTRGQRMAPAFLFVDPYGFKIPIRLLADLMKAGRVELFINVMWRELDMLICQRPASGTAAAQTLDDLFGGDSWRDGVTAADSDARLNQAIPLIAPRWTGQNRPFVDTSKPAIPVSGIEAGLSSIARRLPSASPCGPSFASSVVRTSAHARDAAGDRGAR